MKKTIYLLAALTAMVACSKEDNASNKEPESSSFQKGRMVTISVSAPESLTRVAGTDNGDSFSFKWEEGDKIKVKDNYGFVNPQVFTLVTGAGTKNGARAQPCVCCLTKQAAQTVEEECLVRYSMKLCSEVLNL